jgi:hypothetical protein
MAHELPPPNSGDLHWSRQKRSAECQPTGWQAEFRSLRGNHLVKMCIEGCEKGLWTRLEDPKLALFPAFRGISMLNIQGIQGLTLQNFTLKKVRLPRFISKCSRCKAWSFKIWMFKDWMIDASMVKVEDCWRFKVWRDTCVYIYTNYIIIYTYYYVFAYMHYIGHNLWCASHIGDEWGGIWSSVCESHNETIGLQ